MIVLPWPPKELSPNARVHWAVKARAAKQYRALCAWEVVASKVKAPKGKIRLRVEFLAPSRRRNDMDNCIARMKAGFDGMADAWGVNDAKFEIEPVMSDRLGGEVRVTVL